MAIKSIGIVGCGAIGKALVKAVEDGKLAVRVAGVTSRTEKSAREFLAPFKSPPPYLPLDELVRGSDLIVEAAGGHIVAELARKTFAAGKKFIVVSGGAPGGKANNIGGVRGPGWRLLGSLCAACPVGGPQDARRCAR